MSIEKGVAIVGGGPAGLYLSILLRLANPELDVSVRERNAPQDAYGFGVVFSDETLDNFEIADPASHRALVDRFRHWGQIRARHPEGAEIVSGGHGFAAISRRALLETLTERARELGVDMRFSTEVTRLRDLGPVGVIVGADGANSTVRRELETELGFSMEHARNKYIWFGTAKVFDEFNFIFEDTPSGMVWAHIYPYGEEGSTFIVEMRPETWAALGFDKTEDEVFPAGVSDDYALRRCEEIFASHLDGLGLLGNNSRWLQFPTIVCERWHHGKVVLIGDAVHTAHFSVGSGTKLAMEDAIALAGLLNADHPLDKAFGLYEETRRPEVESLQRAAKASRDWFEGADRYRDMDPEQFVFSMLTRSQRITYDNLRVRDPGYMAGIDAWYAGSNHSCPTPVDSAVPPMFHPFQIRGLELANRIVVSPMDQYSAVEGVPNEWHLVHLGSRAVGGAGLVLTEMTCVSPEGRISPRCTGLWNREQAGAFARIVDFVHTHTDSRIGLQIGHSGRKGSTKLMWEGDSEPLEDGNWEIMGPSPIRYRPDSQVPREMTHSDMDLVRDQHVAAARFGNEAGFDLLERHYAHGYLL
ncbi:MAG TPA: FAD-dependent monooxygenase, partial [Acidimicrobiia bacterium]|nr:FAD-dependent monooxygenase [Acidimicrobiia bacterium]